ncbi:MAG TPA: hypothetical protein VGR02_16750 [Thermoanaerobaculia bacterium]|jgi:hypothetical protein|nr:hypothetical protein [Thermoanaerobaculia bacterium]
MKRSLAIAVLLLAAAAAATAQVPSQVLLANAWPEDANAPLADLGRGIGVVFSPDLSVPGNCRFYQALGFACFDDADWSRVLDGIHAFNQQNPDRPITTLILETHGTNGNGLKLQRSYDPKADRSYISVGGLQERLDPDGIRFLILSACNSGRLLRPSIIATLDPRNGDKLFLPPTRGIVNASSSWRPGQSRSTILTPGASHIETSLAAHVRELGPATRKAIAAAAKAHGIRMPDEFAVSDMLMQMVLRDAEVDLQLGRHVEQLSGVVQPQERSEELFRRFTARLDSVASRASATSAASSAR